MITGGSSGLGFATACLLAAGGAEIVLAVRDAERGERAARAVGATSCHVLRLDVSDLASVHRFAAELERCDVLINNAGIMAVPFGRSVDGFELQIATNHLGHFALTALLLAQDKVAERVVVVSSQAHRNALLEVDDLSFDRRPYDAYEAYADSKLANLLFMAELQRRLTAQGSRVRATGAHPGYTATKLTENTKNRFFNALAHVGNKTVGMTPTQGARCIVAAAVMDVPGNTYFGPGGPGQLWGEPEVVSRSERANDPVLAARLWVESEQLTGVGWPDPPEQASRPGITRR